MWTRRAFLARAGLPALAALPRPRRAEDRAPGIVTTRLLLGGDVMMSRHVGRLARAQNDAAWPWRDIAPLFQSADLGFVNLEAPFLDEGKPMESGMVFKTEPEMIQGLKLAGIDVVSTANNHARDRGAKGVEFTLDWLARHEIAAAGSGASEEAAHAGVVRERNGLRFGFLAYTYDQANGLHKDVDPRVAVLDVERMRQDVASLRTRADIAVVSMHAGHEYQPLPNSQQQEFARAAIDAGATVVAGHHPHVLQPWERYHGGVIYYSLGNLIFDQFQRVETQRGALAEVTFEGSKLARARLLPVEIVRTVPRYNQAMPLPPEWPVAGAAGKG